MAVFKFFIHRQVVHFKHKLGGFRKNYIYVDILKSENLFYKICQEYHCTYSGQLWALSGLKVMRNQETEFCYTCFTSGFLGTSIKNLLFYIIVHRLIKMLPKLTRMWKWIYKTIPILCLVCLEHIIIYAKIQKSLKFGQQGETSSCMQEYNLGDFSKFYP